MREFESTYIAEKMLVCRSLVLVAKNTSSAIDKFTLWMLTAFAAGLTYLIGQDSARFSSLKGAGLIFLAAVLTGILQRWIALIVTNCGKVFKAAQKLVNPNTPIDLARFLIVYLDSLTGFQRAAIAWSAVQIIKGDWVSTGRALYKLTIFQAILATISFALLFQAAYVALKAI